MALTLTRWLVAALVGCAAIATWALREAPAKAPAAPQEQDPGAALFARVRAAAAPYATAYDRLRLVTIRDSLTARPPSVATGSTIVENERFLTSPYFRRVLPGLLTKAGTDRPRHPVTPVEIALVLDTGSTVRRTFRTAPIDVFLPGAAFNDRCLVVDREIFGEGFPPPAWSVVGPCAYYEAFGPPGPRIDRWLREQGWRFGHQVSWRSSLSWLNILLGNRPVDAVRAASLDTIGQDYLGARGLRCASGDVSACESAVMMPSAGTAAPTWGAGIVSSSLSAPNALSTDHELGPGEEALLSEMVRTLGPDRFARFWRSDLDPAQAFRAAAGISLGDWTHDWVVRQYGARTRGPTVSRAGFGLTGIILIVGLAIGFRAVQTRRVG